MLEMLNTVTGALGGMGTILNAGATFLNTTGALARGRQAEASAEYNATLLRNNAMMTRQWADAEAKRILRVSRQQQGRTRAVAGASAVSASSGSIVDVMNDDLIEATMDVINTRRRAQVEALDYEGRRQAVLMQGKFTREQSRVKALGAVAAGGYRTWNSYKIFREQQEMKELEKNGA